MSLSEFFKHAHEYEVLVGDSRQQDLSTLRFLLAIVQRVYAGESAKDLLKLGKFDGRVQDYLNDYKNHFDMFGETPFYQGELLWQALSEQARQLDIKGISDNEERLADWQNLDDDNIGVLLEDAKKNNFIDNYEINELN